MASDNADQMDLPPAVVRGRVLCPSVSRGSLKPVSVVSDAFPNY